MRKFIRTILAAFLCLSALSLTVSAEDGILASGSGWSLDETGTLYVTEELDSTEPLWSEFSAQVRKVVLNDEAAAFVWDGMFADCTALEEIVLAEETGRASVIDGVLFGSGGELRCYPAAKPDTDYVIPADCTLICGRAFAGAGNLKSVTIPENMRLIVDYTFENCTSLSSVSQAGGELTLFFPENAFAGCTSMDPAFIERFCWDEPFYDVTPQTEYFEGIRYVFKEGLMNGVSAAHFAPESPMTRAMFVTVLGRMAGVTDVRSDMPFVDVEEGQWYTDYVRWGASNGILQGYGNGYFGVNDQVTVEQAAVILYRYAKMIETPLYDMEADYTDTDEISAWAMDAMRWVTATDIYTGYDGELRPKQNAPRALVAEMLYNYVRETETPDEIPEKKISEVENPDWGLTLTASFVTPTDMTLGFVQSGGNPTGEYLMSGWYYFIEVFKDGQWTKVEPIKEINAWVDEGWKIPLNGGRDVTDFSWETQYGALPSGQYRMGKRVRDVRGPGDYDYAIFYAEFTIE